MGQAFRRAAGRIGTSVVDSPPTTASKFGKQLDTRPPIVTSNQLPSKDEAVGSENAPSEVNEENLLEDRNPKYDIMLNQMVGRIQSKPGGKPEMGEASVVEKYRRPMPKLRNTTINSSRYEDKVAPPGTLNVAQLRRIILLYQGKADDHTGPMGVNEIAKQFRVDADQVQNILKSVALPPEDAIKKEQQ